MRLTTQRIGLVLAVFLLSVSVMPSLALAQTGTPVSAVDNYPAEFCTEAEIETDNFDSVLTPGENAVVRPVANPDQHLYLLQTTMPPDACLGFGNHLLHDGAILWFVASGEIEMRIEPIEGLPEASLQLGTPSETGDSIDTIQDEVGALSATLTAGSWVSADSAVHYSYGNSGDQPAVILMTVLETLPESEVTTPDTGSMMIFANCKGNCRNPRR